MFAYQLAVVVDDAAMGIREVVRGADLLDSTPRQLYLYRLLDLTPPSFVMYLCCWRRMGGGFPSGMRMQGLEVLQGRMSAQAVLGKLAYLAGFHPSAEPASAWELLAEFDWDKVPRTDIRLPEHFFER